MNGYFIGLDTHTFNFHSFPQVVVEALTCIAVNGFILITGFFGVKLSFHTFWKLWQALFCIYVPLFILKYVFDRPDYGFSFQELCNAIFPFSTRDGYFINGYVFLVISSPFLNAFIASNSKKKVLLFTVSLLIFEFWIDCICKLQTFFFNEGYSGLHFCMIYLIGQCIRLYYDNLKKIKPKYFLALYFVFSSIIVVLSIFKVSWAYFYSNIFMIMSAISFFLYFALKPPLYSKCINKIAMSSLFVYILQINSPFMGWLCSIDTYLLENMNWYFYIIMIIILSACFYFICFVWDSTRQLVAGHVFDIIEAKLVLIFRGSIMKNNSILSK